MTATSTPDPWFVRARLKTRHLMLLAALDDEANLHRAAQLLNVTQPAASKLLKELEDTLGVPLFDRLPRGMRTNWYGEAMIRHARSALASLHDAYDEVDALRSGRSGQVGIGTVMAPAITLLPETVALVHRQQPKLRIALQIESSDVLLERLLQGKLDFMLGRLFERHDKADVRYQALVEEPACAVVRPGHPWLSGVRLELRDLAGGQWIVPPLGSVLRHRFDLMFHEAGLEGPGCLIETTAMLFLTRMLQQSDMVAVMAADVGRYYAQNGMLAVLPIELPCRMDSYGLITPSDRPLSPAATVVLKALHATVQRVYGLRLDGSGGAWPAGAAAGSGPAPASVRASRRRP